MQCTSNICSAASSLFEFAETGSDAKALHLGSFGWVLKKCHQSRRHYFLNFDHLHPSSLTEAFPVELIPTSAVLLWCQQWRLVQQNAKFLEESQWILPPLSLPAHCEGRFPLPDCPINQPPAGRGSFLVPVTTSDCLGCNTNWMSSSQQLIIALTWQKVSHKKVAWSWMKKILSTDRWLHFIQTVSIWDVSFHVIKPKCWYLFFI